jgi:hypothetical protein
MPPGGRSDTLAIEALGESLRGIAPDGSLVYYEGGRAPPTADMEGELCVVGLADGRVLIKYLHSGREAGRYDLESAASPTLRGEHVTWASLVTAIIPGPQARRLILRPTAPARAPSSDRAKAKGRRK